MTTASNHCATQFAHSAPGLLGVTSYGPPPAFGPERRKDNVFYVAAKVIDLPDTRIASGEEVRIYEINDHRGYLSIPGDGTSPRILTVVVIPESLNVNDYVHLSIGSQPLGVDIPATLMQNVVVPNVGIKTTQVPIVQAKPAPKPAPVVNPAVTTVPAATAPTKPAAGRTNGNAPSPTTINASIIGPSTPRQVVVPDPSDRQLVVFENNTANPDYGRLLGIPPDQAKGIGLPAFNVGTTLPVAGTTAGEGYYVSNTGMAFVWNGSNWKPITPRAEIQEWSTNQNYIEHEVVEWKNVLWVAIQDVAMNQEPVSPSVDWRPLSTTGMVSVPSACDATNGLASIPKIPGAHAVAMDTGHIYTLIAQGAGSVWVEIYGAVVEQAVGSQVRAGDLVGEIRMFAGNVTMQPGWVPCDGRVIPPTKVQAISLLGANVPDLTDQFIRGASQTDLPNTTGPATTGAPTGGLTVSGNTDEDGEHKHKSNVTALYPNQVPIDARADRVARNSPTGDSSDARYLYYSQLAGKHSHTLSAVTTSGWDAETAPQHYRVLFAIFLGI